MLGAGNTALKKKLVMSAEPFYPKSRNISVAWAETFLRLIEPGVSEITPAVIVVTDFNSGVVNEDPTIRALLDQDMARLDLRSCEAVASTIFPVSMWNPKLPDNAEQLFQRYERVWPRIKHRDRANNRGNYFRRLTSFQPKGSNVAPVNQLRHVVETYQKGNHRRSALQASVFDPTRDHVHSRILGFPCLQQVGFAPVGDSGLCVTGFYSLQYLFAKAYGNYLGLCHLGRFMAIQMGRTLVQMTCVASALKLGDQSKGGLKTFANNLRQYLTEKQAQV